MFMGNPSVSKFLTKGKWYDIITKKTQPSYHVILNDFNQERRYKIEYFMTLQQVREKNLTDLGI